MSWSIRVPLFNWSCVLSRFWMFWQGLQSRTGSRGYTFGTMEFSFISTLNMAALSHEKPESAAMFHDSCDDQESNKRNKLLASVPLFCGIYSNDMSLQQNYVFSWVCRLVLLRTFYLTLWFFFISQLELLCILTASIERSAIGNTLKDHIISLGIVRQALEYITVSRLPLKGVKHGQSPVIYMTSVWFLSFMCSSSVLWLLGVHNHF